MTDSASAEPTPPGSEAARYGTQSHFDNLWEFLTVWHRKGRDFDPALPENIKDATWEFPALRDAVLEAEARGAKTSQILRARHGVFPEWFERRLLELEGEPPVEWKVTRKEFGDIFDWSKARTPMLSSYRIISKLGSGGMADVFKGLLRGARGEPDQTFAIKIPKSNREFPQNRLRFAREMEKMRGLNHPNIVRIESSSEAVGCLVMEHVYGPSLEDLIRHHANRPVPLYLAVDLIRQIALALQCLESLKAGLIHRDLKPSNILLERSGAHELTPYGWRGKLADFGVAFDPEDPAITRSGALVGTPSYMAPELLGLTEHPISARADVFSLGVIAYQLFTGSHPFQGDSFGERYSRFGCGIKTLDPTKWNPELPDRMKCLIEGMMELGPERRPSPGGIVRPTALTQPWALCHLGESNPSLPQ